MMTLEMETENESYHLPIQSDDRRSSTRLHAWGWAEARRVENTIDAHQQPCVCLAMRDISAGGLKAVSNHPLDRGEKIVLYLATLKNDHTSEQLAHVVRCEPTELGYQIAVQYDTPLAA